MNREVIIKSVAYEVAFHPRTQTRYRGPGDRVSWHCGCGTRGVSDGRSGAIKDHMLHVQYVVRKLLETLL